MSDKTFIISSRGAPPGAPGKNDKPKLVSGKTSRYSVGVAKARPKSPHRWHKIVALGEHSVTQGEPSHPQQRVIR